MSTHTFIADTAQDAVEQIRAELGPSAVVLSVRKVPRNAFTRLMRKEQIEVVARLEDEESTTPLRDPVLALKDELGELKQELLALQRERKSQQNQPAFGRNEPWHLEGPPSNFRNADQSGPFEVSQSELSSFLLESGLLPKYCSELVNEVPPALRSNPSSYRPYIAEVLRSHWRVGRKSTGPRVHLFVGVPGSGKSTLLCKMLARHSITEQKAATLYQLDSHIANTAGHVSLFAEIAAAHIERTMPERFEASEETVFVDVPGVALGDEKGLARVRSIIDQFGAPEIHLVLNLAYEATLLLEQVRFFANLGITDLLATHLDEEKRWGKLWNLVLGTNYNIGHLSVGQNVPGDLLEAEPQLILKRQFGGN